MQATERLRERMAAAGVELPPELVDVGAMAAGPMITSLDALLALDLGDLDPFSPARRLPDDAGGCARCSPRYRPRRCGRSSPTARQPRSRSPRRASRLSARATRACTPSSP